MSVARWLGSFAEPRYYTSLDQSLWLHRARGVLDAAARRASE